MSWPDAMAGDGCPPASRLVDWAGDHTDSPQLHPRCHGRRHAARLRRPPAAGRAPVLAVKDDRRGPGRGLQGPRSVSLARSLTEALDRSGVVFVKFGQAMSTRRDLLPPEFTSELGRLQDRVSPLPWAQIERVLDEELGGTGMFTEID